MEGFEEDRAGGSRRSGAEEVLGLGGVGDGGLFEEDVLACCEGFERPFVVQAVGERDVDGVDGGVVEDGCGRLGSGR